MRVILTGASGQLGAYLLEQLVGSGHEVGAWSGTATGSRCGVRLQPVELTNAELTDQALRHADPDVIIHVAAMSAAESVRIDPARGRDVNTSATERLARWCARFGRRIVYTSTDLVFDGTRAWNREEDPASPVLAYGRTKWEAEASVLDCPRGLVARMSLLYGPSRAGRASYFDRTIETIRQGQNQSFFEDEFRTPLSLRAAADAVLQLAGSDVAGLVHVGGRERMSRYQLMKRAVSELGLDTRLVVANRQRDASLPEPRPADVSLDTTRLATLLPNLYRPSIEEALSGSHT
jgi:dTDP-4-dehydrorhamnose reductase